MKRARKPAFGGLNSTGAVIPKEQQPFVVSCGCVVRVDAPANGMGFDVVRVGKSCRLHRPYWQGYERR